MVIPVGALVNAGAIVAGAGLGLAAGRAISARLRDSLFQILGVCVVLLGTRMGLAASDLVIPVVSCVLGLITGEALNLAGRLNAAGDAFKRLLKSGNEKFTDGLVTATIIMGVGAMGLVGSMEEGLGGSRTILYSKSILDFFMAMMLGSVYGSGVLASAAPILAYQGGVTLLAGGLAPHFTDGLRAGLTATGGLLVMGIGLNLLGLKPIAVSNLLPALVYVAALSLFLA
ncbi:MAG: DUF554 domain-containing protein [Candidatus Adiutrix sp.]|jgi:uncharacterized membrane protein YqgA involved in biofilm formation|nr:DUF554 domain-containing protein [Candidatus Adiutrix sp.]